ncbi:MAG: O-antigen export system permease [Magnetospirillum sp.]|nr:MAG: O-antigen export system permease [Magnetospirillum sp.]
MSNSVVTRTSEIWRYRRLLFAAIRYELAKRYAGSLIGVGWALLQPLLFLCLYLFLYMVVFKVRFPGYSEMDYVAFVFAGLVPFLGAVEAVNGSSLCIKQNIHLVKNVVMPIDLIPVRVVAVALVTQCIGLALVIVLYLAFGYLSPAVIGLPVVLALQAVMLVGVAWLLAALGVLIPDLGQVVNLVMLFLMFISPIAFRPEMVPPQLAAVLAFNPFHYMLSAFRSVLLAEGGVVWSELGVFALLAFGSACLGAVVFGRLKGVIIDYE